MKINTILLGIILLIVSPLLIFGCGNNSRNSSSPKNAEKINGKDDLPTIELPSEMPADTQMRYSENGGMSPAYRNVKVFGNQLFIEEVTIKVREKQMWSAEISDADQNELYQYFVANKFNLIKKDERGEIVYDAGSRGISIQFDKKIYGVQSGDNFPLSGENSTRWSNVRAAFEKLEVKYKEKLKPKIENYAVIMYKAKSHLYNFKNVRSAEFNSEEFEQLDKLIIKAVEQYNMKPLPNGKTLDLSEYKFQYVPVINANKEKEVWVNAFCNAYDIDWKKQIVDVDGGGNCFFNLKINLSKSSISEFNINAPK